MYGPELVSMWQLGTKGLSAQNFRTNSHSNQRDQLLILTFPVLFFLPLFINNSITSKPTPKEIFKSGERRKSQIENETFSNYHSLEFHFKPKINILIIISVCNRFFSFTLNHTCM